MSDTPTVQEALAAVMAELPSIGKDDRSPEGYQYRGIEAVTRHAQPLFAKHGVVIAPHGEITDVRPSPAMKEGWQDVYMRVTWTITGPDGSTLTAQTNGIGRDKSDKGANKAQTQAFKYLLLQLLCIADGKDDPDALTYEHDRSPEEDPAVPGLRTAVQGAIDKLDDDQKAQLKLWFAAENLPPVRRMDGPQCDRVIEHLMALPSPEPPAESEPAEEAEQ
jgi:hypothetical protein